MAQLLHELIGASASRAAAAVALRCASTQRTYGQLALAVQRAADAMLELGLQSQERVAVFLEKRDEAVLAMFGASAAGAVFVPLDPLLKPDQVGHILRDSGATMLVTSPARFVALDCILTRCPDLRVVLHTGEADGASAAGSARGLPALPGVAVLSWNSVVAAAAIHTPHRAIDTDMAALLYSANASGPARAMVLSHRNLVAGAHSLARTLDSSAHDRVLALLPLTGEYGLAQLTCGFASGAAVILSTPLLTRDILGTVERERISGLAAVPSQWIQLAALDWSGAQQLRYLTNSGGTLPLDTVLSLRQRLPHTAIHLMHGSEDACRATCLAPEQAAWRPGSIGKAAPGAEVLVLDADGRRCAANEPGELVQRGALVPSGFWNGAARAATQLRPVLHADPLPTAGRLDARNALWSGDLVRMDDDGYLYYLGRSDDLIVSAGQRISPSEIEQVVRATGLVAEVAVFGLPHPVLGHSVTMVARARPGCVLEACVLQAACRAQLPAALVPTRVELWPLALPRGEDGAIDRVALAQVLRQDAALPLAASMAGAEAAVACALGARSQLDGATSDINSDLAARMATLPASIRVAGGARTAVAFP